MLFLSCGRILLFPLLSSPHGPNKVMLDPSCTWIRCTRVSSWYSNGPFNSDLVETFKTNAFNASFNAFVLDRVIGPFGTCNGSLLVFLGWSTSLQFLNKLNLTYRRLTGFVASFYFILIVLVSWGKFLLSHTLIRSILALQDYISILIGVA